MSLWHIVINLIKRWLVFDFYFSLLYLNGFSRMVEAVDHTSYINYLGAGTFSVTI